MFGIHGIRAVREGKFKELIRGAFGAPLAGGLPKERLHSDLNFLIESAPFAIWIAENRAGASSGEIDCTLEQAHDSALAVQWLEQARAGGKLWLASLSADDLDALSAELRRVQGKRANLALGTYFGALFEFWLRNCPSIGVEHMSSSVRVNEGNVTLGSLKYVWVYAGKIMHLECSIKFFAKHGDYLIGPHLSETLDTRFRFAEKKLKVAQLASDPLCKLLECQGNIHSMALIQGYLFTPLTKEDDLLAEEGATVHSQHINKDALTRWYSSSFDRVLEQFSCANSDEGLAERWTVLPKLYWLSEVTMPVGESEMARFGLPLLEVDDMAELLRLHFSWRPRATAERQVPRRRSGLTGVSPLMICQVRLDRASNCWREHTRGFVLGQNWDPSELLAAELNGTGVPNEPAKLEIRDRSRIECMVGDAAAGCPNPPVDSRSSAQGVKPGEGHGCMTCRTFDLRVRFKNACSLSERLGAILGSLFACKDTFAGRRAARTLSGFAPNGHTQHVVADLVSVLSDNHSEVDVAEFALQSSSALIAPSAHGTETFHLSPKALHSVSRILLRCCEQSLRDKPAALAAVTVSLPGFPRYAMEAFQHDHLSLLASFLSAGADPSELPIGCAKHATGKDRQELKQLLAKTALDPAKRWSEALGGLVVGLVRSFALELPSELYAEIIDRLLESRKFVALEQLAALNDTTETKLDVFRCLAVRARRYRHVSQARNQFEGVLSAAYPVLDLSPVHHELPLYDELFSWNGDAGPDVSATAFRFGHQNLGQLSTLIVDSAESLQAARAMVERAREETTPGAKLVVGIDAEWGRENPTSAEDSSDWISVSSIRPYLSLWQVAVTPREVLLVDFDCLFCRGESGEVLARQALDFVETLLGAKNTILVGFSVHEDLKRLRAMLGSAAVVRPNLAVVDAQCVLAAFVPETALEHTGDPYGISLARWTRMLLGADMDKSYQCSDWSSRPLSIKQERYAALDAVAPLRLLQHVMDISDSVELERWAMQVPLAPLNGSSA